MPDTSKPTSTFTAEDRADHLHILDAAAFLLMPVAPTHFHGLSAETAAEPSPTDDAGIILTPAPARDAALGLAALVGERLAGISPDAPISTHFDGVMERNIGRTWPDWRTADPNGPIEHVHTSAEGVKLRRTDPPEAAPIVVQMRRPEADVSTRDLDARS